MKKLFLFVAIISAVTIISACGSNEDTNHNGQMQGNMQEGMQGHMQDSESMGMGEGNMQMASDKEWIRSEPIDVKALDANGDGFVYQDQMDWNVIADQEGKCPKCGMTLKKVTVEQAEQNLVDNGFKIKTNG